MIVKKAFNFKQYAFERISGITERFKLPEKWKGGRIEKWGKFWEGLYQDYRSVATDTIQDYKANPRKAFFVTSGLGTLFAALQLNPDKQSFHEAVVNCTTTLSMVSDPIKNPISENHINYLTRCENHGLLRRTDLMFLTLMWVADNNIDCNIYAARCRYLQPSWFTFHERVIDVGVFGMWLNLRLKMRDFDINPNEWDEA